MAEHDFQLGEVDAHVVQCLQVAEPEPAVGRRRWTSMHQYGHVERASRLVDGKAPGIVRTVVPVSRGNLTQRHGSQLVHAALGLRGCPIRRQVDGASPGKPLRVGSDLTRDELVRHFHAKSRSALEPYYQGLVDPGLVHLPKQPLGASVLASFDLFLGDVRQ